MSRWKTVKLSEVATIERSGVQPEQIEDGTRYVGLEHIEKGGRLLGLNSVDAGELASSKFQFSKQHILYGKLRPYLAKIACPEFSGICSTDILPILPSSSIDRKFLFHFLRQQTMVDYANSQSVGANLPRLNPSVLANFELPLPPLEEQRRIAEILDRAESLRAMRRQSIEQLNTLTQATFLKMFGDPVANGWAMTTVNEMVHPSKGSIRSGPFGSQLLHSEFTEEGVAVLGIDNAVANEFRWDKRRFISKIKYQKLKRYTVRPDDVLITIMGTCGRCAIVPDNIPLAINTKHLCCITLDLKKCLSRFLHAYFLLHPIARQYLNQTRKGAIMDGLNMSIIQSMPIPITPLTLQNKFAQRVEAIEKLKVTHQKSLIELDALFASLQHRAFRGEL